MNQFPSKTLKNSASVSVPPPRGGISYSSGDVRFPFGGGFELTSAISIGEVFDTKRTFTAEEIGNLFGERPYLSSRNKQATDVG